ncbi:hypothetical protein KEM60_02289 [Austwickia sp. TVS 96-490-7B]|uniref:hypothetical protein n=1 Tax=Austwickia sp. TVS 96-490-7B TaxID=2830843 RepID=UPI001C56661E|nr:hypothetical protein [Austwickia sp. TVS 96-490-7B]MBW3086078.1 hypothetical protein [Austwickia sp. TVS 96-490-7B]
MTQSWSWNYLDNAGTTMSSVADGGPFASQGDAESFLGGSWPELADEGVAAVTLLCDGAEFYGPMPLTDMG